MISKWKLGLLVLLTYLLAFFWDQPFMLFLKVFVVYLHELSHGLATLATGGEVVELSVAWNESGFAKVRGGNFFAIASAGYLGSILWGSLMLYFSLSGFAYRTFSFLIGLMIVVSTFYFVQHFDSSYYFTLFWGLFLLIMPVLLSEITRIVIFLLGGLTSMYAVYDLADFFRGDIFQTDAGILSSYYFGNGLVAWVAAYAIGISISFVSVWLVYSMILYSLRVPEAEEWEEEEMEQYDWERQR